MLHYRDVFFIHTNALRKDAIIQRIPANEAFSGYEVKFEFAGCLIHFPMLFVSFLVWFSSCHFPCAFSSSTTASLSDTGCFPKKPTDALKSCLSGYLSFSIKGYGFIQLKLCLVFSPDIRARLGSHPIVPVGRES